MSTHTITVGGMDTINAIHTAIRRLPTTAGDIQADGSQVLTYLPDLTASESATLDLVAATVAASAPLTTDRLTAIRAQMQTLRALRQMGRNSFMALSQAERDRQIYDALVAVTQIFISMTRDGS